MSRSRRPEGAARTRRAAASVGAALLGGATVAALAGPAATAGAAPSTTSAPTVVLTVPTAGNHGYRHGAVPRRTRDVAGVRALGSTPSAPGTMAAAPAGARTLHYGGGLTAGGLSAAGVTTAQPRIYLVFMGDQWGTESINGAGQHLFTGDTASMAPAIQTLFRGLGTGSETWSGVMTQYCDGAPVGASSCTQGDALVAYPSGGVLSGIWYDSSSTATSQESAGLTGNQLATEAEAAATHFANSDQLSNRTTQYVIVSPPGANPDGWMSPTNGYCAYHDDSHDPTLSGGGAAAGPIVAFTNLPYVPDAGGSCGAGTVNTPGTLDGATEAASHEYAETVTDQFPENNPPGGWSSSTGQENGDLCAYVATGPGAMFNLALTTGTVTVQGTWSNRANNCEDGESTFAFVPTVTSFSPGRGPAGSSVTISGTNLAGATSARLAGTPAIITVDTSTSLTVTVPTGSSDGNLSVTTPFGTAVSAKSFFVAPTVTSFAPNPVIRGGTLTISGSGLGSVRKVTVGGKKATITAQTAAQITVTVGPKAVSGSVTVASKYGSSTLAGLVVS